RSEVEARHRVAGVLPVDQVVRAQDRRAGGVVHGGGRVVVRVADADDVAVGEVLPHHRVGVGAGVAAAGADRYELPLLVGAVPVGVLDDVGTVRCGRSLHLDGLVAVAVDQ